jgi:hypothetical protein
MRPGGGKQKGASFEREVCVLLSKWVTNGKREDVFWRSAMSGGRATVGHRKGKNHSTQVGDISCIHPAGHHFSEAFAPECKFYADLNYTGLITGKGKLLDFWAEIKKQAGRYKKHPFLVARQNRMRTTVCLDNLGLLELGMSKNDALLFSPRYNMYIFDFEQFLKACKPYVASDWRPAPNRQRARLI